MTKKQIKAELNKLFDQKEAIRKREIELTNLLFTKLNKAKITHGT